MRFEWLASSIYLGMAALCFGWTLVQPGVSLDDFAVPMAEYSQIVILVWPLAVWGVVMAVLIATPFRKAAGPAYRFILDWIAYHWTSGWFIHLAAPMAAFVVTMASFTVHKTVVLAGYEFSWDMIFADMDRWMFFGTDPWRLSHYVFSSDLATWVIDQLYHTYFYPMLIAYFLCSIVSAAPLARACYLGTYLISFWVIGCISAGMLMSAGPVYDGQLFGDGQYFADLNTRLDGLDQRLGSLASQGYQGKLLTAYTQGHIATGHGISAMPSMHIAMAMMWALLFFQINRLLGCLGLLYAAIIWIGSFHLGWHYAVDGVVAAPVTVLIWVALRANLRRWAKAPGTAHQDNKDDLSETI